MEGMRSERGYTLFEVLIVLGLIGVISGIALPVFLSSNAMNSLWTSSERLGGLVRQTRLRAISRNTTYQLRFNCPAAGAARGLIVTGNPAIDAAANRCSLSQDGDTEIVYMNPGVTYTPAAGVTGFAITGRGVFTTMGGAIPTTVNVAYGAKSRYLTVSPTGQITFSDTAP
jgi:prepilin-type N-terminal cleavage/methylation domain-containing protein